MLNITLGEKERVRAKALDRVRDAEELRRRKRKRNVKALAQVRASRKYICGSKRQWTARVQILRFLVVWLMASLH